MRRVLRRVEPGMAGAGQMAARVRVEETVPHRVAGTARLPEEVGPRSVAGLGMLLASSDCRRVVASRMDKDPF